MPSQVSATERLLPGDFLYYSDILCTPEIVSRMGEILATEFEAEKADFVLTMETKGIPVAFATAHALGIPLVIARHSSKVYEGSAVNINYVSGSGNMETMSLSRRAVRENQRALIVDDFLRGGGTARGMVELMREFNVKVVGMAFVMATVKPEKKRISGEKALMTLTVTDEEIPRAVVKPAQWLG
jgi:purine operon repressor